MADNFWGIIAKLGLLGGLGLAAAARSIDVGGTVVRSAPTNVTPPPVVRTLPDEILPTTSRLQSDASAPIADDIVGGIARGADSFPTIYDQKFEPTLKFLSALPDTTAEFQKVFGDTASLATGVLEDTFGASRNIDELNQTTSSAKSIDDIKIAISESDENVIILVGHNENGILQLPNGETINIQEVAQQCADGGKRCVILSCESAQYIDESDVSTSGVTRVISASEAAFISRRLGATFRKAYNNDVTLSYRDVDLNIRLSAAESERLALRGTRSRQVAKVIAASGTIGAISFFDPSDRD